MEQDDSIHGVGAERLWSECGERGAEWNYDVG